MPDSLDWAEVTALHRRSMEEFLGHARQIPQARWNHAAAAGKWSPAQIAEHLRLTYEAVTREATGGPALRVRTSWWLRLYLRFAYLRRILDKGAIPTGARAPRELMPGPGPFEQEALLTGLAAAVDRAEAAFSVDDTARARGFTHHVFGRLDAAEALRFATVHNEHHARQLPGG
jgi:hypothetical protein